MNQPTVADIIEIVRLYLNSMNPLDSLLSCLPGTYFEFILFILYATCAGISLLGLRDVYQHFKLVKRA